MNRKFLAAVVLGQLAFGAAIPALAGEAAGPDQVAVAYSQIDLQSAASKQALKRRLTRAAQSVCPDKSAADLGTRVAGKRCVRQAVDQAMDTVGERQLARAAAVSGDRG